MSNYDPVLWNMGTRLIEQWKTRGLTISHCAEGWLRNNGFPSEQTCGTVLALGREKYLALHEGVHVIWKVARKQGSTSRISHYCDAHLPADIRALVEADGGDQA